MFISLIFPCHNEEQAIPLVIPEALKVKQELIEKKQIKNLEIIVINDASTDSSLLKLKKYEKEIKILSLAKQEGYGSALQKAFQQAQGDWLAFCDLDNTCDPKELSLLIDLAHDQNLTMAWGDRLNKNSQISFVRKLGNQLYQLAFLILSFKKIPDPCSGFRLFKKSSFDSVLYKLPKDLSFALALTSHCVRHKIPFQVKEISYRDRLGQSKLQPFKDGWIFLIQLVRFLFF
ncbi:MAG: glycosyltransferase family 2 protein [Oligoflexia bacterium]|nr:glycosyltransferase family 2 protein [Oligoflexia bacterium]